MKQVVVGHFSIGSETVELVLREGGGGEYYFQPEPGKCARIKVWADCEWRECVSAFLHEAMEFACHRRGKLFQESSPFSIGSDNRIIVMNHAEFSIVCTHVAEFVMEAMPELANAFTLWRKGKS